MSPPPAVDVVETVGSKRGGRPLSDNLKQVDNMSGQCLGKTMKKLLTYLSGAIDLYMPTVHEAGSRGPSYFGCGCTSEIVVTSHGSDLKNVVVAYNFEHIGHVPGSIDDLRAVGVPAEIRDVIVSLVERNLTWVNIKHMIRMDRVALERILNGETTNIPESIQVSYQTVYYAIKKCMEGRAYLDKNMVGSLRLWGSQKIQPDGHYLAKNLDQHQRGMYFFAFMSNWQLQVNYRGCEKKPA